MTAYNPFDQPAAAAPQAPPPANVPQFQAPQQAPPQQYAQPPQTQYGGQQVPPEFAQQAPPQQYAQPPQQYQAPQQPPQQYAQAPQQAPPQQYAQAPQQAPPPPAAPVPGLAEVGAQQSDDPYSIAVPSGISGIKMSDERLIDQLLLVEPTEYIKSMNTVVSKEPTDAFRVNILPLTGPGTGVLLQDVMVWQDALKRELMKAHQGPNRWLLTYLHYGTAKLGKNAPYLFTPPDEEQMAIFERFRAQQPASR